MDGEGFALLPDAGSSRELPGGASASTGDSLESTRAEADEVRASIEQLFRDHWDELCWVAGAIVGSNDAVEDIVMAVATAVLDRPTGSLAAQPLSFEGMNRDPAFGR